MQLINRAERKAAAGVGGDARTKSAELLNLFVSHHRNESVLKTLEELFVGGERTLSD